MYDVCEITTIHPQDDARILRSITALCDKYDKICFIAPWKRSNAIDPKIDMKMWTLPNSRALRLFNSLIVFIKAMNTNTRIYHFHDLDFILFAVLLKYLKNKPVVYDCHENYPEEIKFNKKWIPYFIRNPLSTLVKHVENWSVSKLGNIIVVTPSQVARFESKCLNVALVRNYSSIDLNSSSNGDAIVYVGSLTKTYGLYQLIDIAKALKNDGIKMYVTDRFVSDVERKYFISEIEDNDLSIELIPKVPASHMSKVLKTAKIGLSPSQRAPNTELGYHSKLIEYMACGLPIVASTVNANMFVLSHVRCGFAVEPSDIGGYVKAIRDIYYDSELCETLRSAGFDAVENEFDWKIEKKHLFESFEVALKK